MKSTNNKNLKLFRKNILGIPVDIYPDMSCKALELHANGGGQIVTLNAEMVMKATKDQELKDAITRAELIVPDGLGVIWALRQQGISLERTSGIEIAKELVAIAEINQWRVALVGSLPKVIKKVQKNFLQEMPNLILEFSAHGYQTQDNWKRIESKLKKLKPDLVLVALGVPLQETWIMKTHKNCPGLWIGIGGSFDIWAQEKNRAPKWMRKMAIEWLYRLVIEPSRWRRMLSLPLFVLAVLRSL